MWPAQGSPRAWLKKSVSKWKRCCIGDGGVCSVSLPAKHSTSLTPTEPAHWLRLKGVVVHTQVLVGKDGDDECKCLTPSAYQRHRSHSALNQPSACLTTGGQVGRKICLVTLFSFSIYPAARGRARPFRTYERQITRSLGYVMIFKWYASCRGKEGEGGESVRVEWELRAGCNCNLSENSSTLDSFPLRFATAVCV